MSSPDSLILNIDGMSCAGCVKSVERALGSVPGVEVALVNFANQTALVKGYVLPVDLIAAVSGVGYRASLNSDLPQSAKQDQAQSRFRDAIRRSATALMLGGLFMADMYLSVLPDVNQQVTWLLLSGLVSLVLWHAGGRFYRGAYNAARHRIVTMDTLIALGTGSAWLYSTFFVVAPEIFPESGRHHFFEAALFIVGFVNLGKSVEEYVRVKAALSLEALFDLAPKSVIRVRGETETEVHLDEIQVGDRLRVNPGQNIPVDGVVIDGFSAVNEAMLTGESMPVERIQGDVVYAGTTNVLRSLVIETRVAGQDTRLAQMSDLVQRAQNSKPPISQLVDRISAVFVPLVILLACCTAIFWSQFAPEDARYAVICAVSVLIIACPCALGLAVPLSIMMATDRAARLRLLFRDGSVLQNAGDIDVMALDKTGTLTEGVPKVARVTGLSKEDLAVVFALERESNHPIARAIVKYCEVNQIAPAKLANIQQVPGGGVQAEYIEKIVRLGSAKFIGETAIGYSDVIYAVDHKVRGTLSLTDEVRPVAKPVIERLNELGVQTMMLSGDDEGRAKQVASHLGINEVYGECLPEEKLSRLQSLQSQGYRVGFVGDGINDAAAMAAADISIAMGGAADVALDASDLVLTNNNLEGLSNLVELSRLTQANIKQNLVFAFMYNLFLIPVAAGLLIPVNGLMINPALAGAAMALSSLTVVANASRLKFF